MVKAKLKILEHEDKTSNGVDYTRFKCEYDDGSTKWMSSFKKTKAEQECVADLKNHENVLISVEVRESNKTNQQGDPYLNLTKFYGKIAGAQTDDEADMEAQEENNKRFVKPQEFGKKPSCYVGKYHPTSMYVSYAKDICVAMISRCPSKDKLNSEWRMKQAIELVKQAEAEFA